MILNKFKKDRLWIRIAGILVFFDALIIYGSYFLSLWLRFDFIYSNIPMHYIDKAIILTPFYVVFAILWFFKFRLYHSIWRFASISELYQIALAFLCLIPTYLVINIISQIRMPMSFYFLGYILSMIGCTALRFSYRFIRSYRAHIKKPVGSSNAQERIMVIGAGSVARPIIRELISGTHLDTRVCCIIDDNPNKMGRLLEGIPIVGNRYDIETKAKEYSINRIIYAIPAKVADNQKEILNICKMTGCKIQIVPGIYQIVNGEVSVSQLRDIEIQDLLGRQQISVNNDEIFELIKDKVILVTGAGGSIGSELCRQIAKASPQKLIILEIYENSAYDIQQELVRVYPNLDLTTLIGSIRDKRRIEEVFSEFRPQYVFHAAAHKHVPLMEQSPREAVKNNVLGTYNLVNAADKYGVKRFLLISTDKAVNPTNVMGATKRLCEMIVQMMSRKSKTEFVAVRFGNVLGSNGSVIPLFKDQIKNGGPVTVTHPEITRYFMTIPEAVSLVLQSSAYAKGGEIFILDMGEPVKIDDMARNLITLSGYTPDVDIQIVYSGLRPGEKLYEELLMDEEGMKDTENKLIHIGCPIEFDDKKFVEDIESLSEIVYDETIDIKDEIARLVPTYVKQK